MAVITFTVSFTQHSLPNGVKRGATACSKGWSDVPVAGITGKDSVVDSALVVGSKVFTAMFLFVPCSEGAGCDPAAIAALDAHPGPRIQW